MKNLRINLIVVFILFVVSVACDRIPTDQEFRTPIINRPYTKKEATPPPPPQETKAEKEESKIKVLESWKFTTGDFELISVEGKHYLISKNWCVRIGE